MAANQKEHPALAQDGRGANEKGRDMRRTARWIVSAAALILLVGCGPGTSDEAAGVSASATSDEPRGGTLTLSSGESVAFWCAGQGSPGVLLEGGDGGIGAYPAAFLDPLIARGTVCTYDRLGTGTSDLPPDRSRSVSDLCDVQDQVVAELALPTPYVLVGQSGGGNVNIGCAARHPERVAGLVTIDSYHDDPEGLREEGFVWTDSPEHVDAVDFSAELDALSMPIGDFPVLVISATRADPGGEQNQRYWLGLSPHSRQVVVEGGHELHLTHPEEVVSEILTDLNGG